MCGNVFFKYAFIDFAVPNLVIIQISLSEILNKNIYLNRFCIPESFNKKIPHQLFKYKINFVNVQLQNTNQKGDFVLKTWF
jgi:hypothetical protein